MKKVDANHSQIVSGLRKVGAVVRSTAMVGNGFPDLACSFRGRTVLLEVKDGSKPPSARRLTEAEAQFFAEWNGGAYVVTSLHEALQAIGAM